MLPCCCRNLPGGIGGGRGGGGGSGSGPATRSYGFGPTRAMAEPQYSPQLYGFEHAGDCELGLTNPPSSCFRIAGRSVRCCLRVPHCQSFVKPNGHLQRACQLLKALWREPQSQQVACWRQRPASLLPRPDTWLRCGWLHGLDVHVGVWRRLYAKPTICPVDSCSMHPSSACSCATRHWLTSGSSTPGTQRWHLPWRQVRTWPLAQVSAAVPSSKVCCFVPPFLATSTCCLSLLPPLAALRAMAMQATPSQRELTMRLQVGCVCGGKLQVTSGV